jgi:hypothetical protein
MATLTRLWVLRALRDHPETVAGRSLIVASPAVEGHTTSGMPIGSVSGLTNQGIPRIVQRLFAIPSAVALVEDPDQRYFLTMRIALQHDVTVIGTPNATTLIRLAEVTRGRADQLLDAIAGGSLGVDPAFGAEGDARTALEELKSACRPSPERARALARAAAGAGELTPRLAWPRLALIGCWLGGSAGVHAGRLAADFGEVPLRDLGLVATEGRLTLPFEDGTPSGVLCVDTTYFEFTPVDAPDRAPALQVHQLERGRAYNVIVTGSNGLYRYDLQDVVEVRGFHGRTPQVAFLRKAGDFVSITGEKVHVNQVDDAVHVAEAATGLHLWQFSLIADVDGRRHDLLVEAREAVTEPRARHFLESFDRRLADLNSEYAAKRRSGRLRPPRAHLMQSGWSERIARAEFSRGRREQQFKWVTLPSAWDGASRAEVELTVDPLRVAG